MTEVSIKTPLFQVQITCSVCKIALKQDIYNAVKRFFFFKCACGTNYCVSMKHPKDRNLNG
jgi:translation initiation factor 2 beta subunit (eIF-2beta)/eIF-5